jgi:hypothetical protein
MLLSCVLPRMQQFNDVHLQTVQFLSWMSLQLNIRFWVRLLVKYMGTRLGCNLLKSFEILGTKWISCFSSHRIWADLSLDYLWSGCVFGAASKGHSGWLGTVLMRPGPFFLSVYNFSLSCSVSLQWLSPDFWVVDSRIFWMFWYKRLGLSEIADTQNMLHGMLSWGWGAVQHTSASLTINENYDSDVLEDVETFLNGTVPEVRETCCVVQLWCATVWLNTVFHQDCAAKESWKREVAHVETLFWEG